MKVERNGEFYEVADGYEWFWPGFASGDWEPNTFKVFDRFLEPDRTYVDIGAWIGPTVLYASRVAKKVLAFEPDPVAYQQLVRNLELNNLEKNVVPYPIAVSNDWKGIPFGPRTTKFGDSMASQLWGRGLDVPAISLASVIFGNDPNFIKIDIEGGEKFIFEGTVIATALEFCQPTVHLSLHTPWFKDDLESYKKAIKEGLSSFPYLYDESGKKVTLDEVINENAFNAVVASFKGVSQ